MPSYRLIQIALLLFGVAAFVSTKPTEDLAEHFQLSITPFPYNSDRLGNDQPIEIGRFQVPAIRRDPGTTARSVEVGFLRYLAAEDAPDRAFVFLSDDRPTSSVRQQMYFSLRDFGDVIVFSHRGFGFSPAPMPCTQQLSYPMSVYLFDDLLSEATRVYADRCLKQLEEAGYPRAMFRYEEIAADLHDLKSVLGKSNLYLVAEDTLALAAIAALQSYPRLFDGAVLINASSSEELSPEHLPRILAMTRNVEDDISRQTVIKKFAALHDKLTEMPERVVTLSSAGRSLLVTIGALDLAFVIKYELADESISAERLIAAVNNASSGDYAGLARLVLESRGKLGNPGPAALIAAANSENEGVRSSLRAIDYAMQWPASNTRMLIVDSAENLELGITDEVVLFLQREDTIGHTDSVK